MYVTDTPVIDRLINPEPMDIVHDIHQWVHDDIDNLEPALHAPIEKLVDECFGVFRENLGGDALDSFNEAADKLVELAAADESDRHLATVQKFADELATRLAAIQ